MDIHVERAEVRQVPSGDSFIELTLEVTDGARRYKHGIGFPADTLEWRAAEYDLDPGDVEALLDLVVAEAFMSQLAENETNLFSAPTIASARQAHLARAEARGLRITRSPDLMATVRSACEIDRETVALKRKLVEKTRERHLSPMASPHRRERLAKQLKQMEEG